MKPRTVTASAGELTPDTAEVPVADPTAAAVPTELPAIESKPLPAVPTVDDPPAAAQQPAPVVIAQPREASEQSAPKPSKESSRKPQRKPSPKPSTTSTASATQEAVEVREISGQKAVDLVLQSTGGGVVKSLEKTTHAGYDAFAVRVLRHDGSVVTGFVERTSGVVFDWQVNQEAPTPSASSTSSSGQSDHDDDDHDDEHESESDDD